LYDLQSDPYELNNLIALDSHNEVKAVLRERLLRRMTVIGETAPTIELFAPAQPGGQRRVSSDETRA
jgi:hypothetical protein